MKTVINILHIYVRRCGPGRNCVVELPAKLEKRGAFRLSRSIIKKKKVIGPRDSWRSSWRAAGLFAFSVANWGTSGFESGNGVLRLRELVRTPENR